MTIGNDNIVWPIVDYVTPTARTNPYRVVGQFLSDEREKDWEAIKRLQDKGFVLIAPNKWR